MLHLLPGKLGHLFVVVSFVFSIASVIAYYLSLKTSQAELSKKYTLFGRGLFAVHAVSAIGIVVALFYIIYQHYYEYHYAWAHSSNNLAVHYMISCFWEGQEGSFLLWIFWHVIIGSVLIFKHPKWESPVMMVFMLVQAFLVSMILGVIIPGLDLKIGSTPFILLKDFMQDAPVFISNPDFIPEDGTGLNPLLQNYWMVIHPPILFLGFASCLVPYSFMMAGLFKSELKEWVVYALPWALFASIFLGLGTIMGGYWAYETLNFGGYWNWDPVENAVYIPWLVLIASVHTLFTAKMYGKALKASMILVTATFILILYSTFLTRSGVLGDTSVHSFTDLGLSGQLLIYLLFFFGMSVFILIKKWKEIPDPKKEINAYSKELWVFVGVTILVLASFQVFVTTSIPVFNAVFNGLGFTTSLAPPADPMTHYGNAQIWFAIAVTILSGLGPFFWWNKLDLQSFKNHCTPPLVISLILSAIIMLLWGIRDITYILLLTAGIFALSSNLYTLFKLYKEGLKLTGGSLAHIGLALLLIGILFSSGYSRVVSENRSGKIYHEDFPEDLNLENILLWRGKSYELDEYKVTYMGPRVETRDGGFMIDRDQVLPTSNPDLFVLDYDPLPPADVLGKRDDTVSIFRENNYYEVKFEPSSGKSFTLFPRAQINPDMGGLLASPDIKRNFSKDLYTHVSSIIDPTQAPEWELQGSIKAAVGDTIFLKDHPAVFESVESLTEIGGHKLDDGDVGVKCKIKIFTPGGEEFIEPIFVIHEQMIGRLPDWSLGLGVEMVVGEILPDENSFIFQIHTTQADYVILKAMEKPWINLLWGGALICLMGMVISMNRRFKNLKQIK